MINVRLSMAEAQRLIRALEKAVDVVPAEGKDNCWNPLQKHLEKLRDAVSEEKAEE